MRPKIQTVLAPILLSLVLTSAHATPPTPPVQLQLPKADELAALQPEEGVITVPAQVQAYQEVPKLTLIVRTTKMGTLGRRQGQVKDYALKGLQKGETQLVAIKIPAQQQDGIYRIEALLRRERDGKVGVLSKGVLIQVVENGKQRLTTPVELRRTEVSRKKQAFQKALAKKPKHPDIRLLMDRTVQVPEELKKHIRPHTGPKRKRVKGGGIPNQIKPYILHNPKREKRKDSDVLPKTDVNPISLLPRTHNVVSGQVVFEDWYTDELGNPVLTPLAQATITTFVDAGPPLGLLVNETVTDENGNWSVEVGPVSTGTGQLIEILYAVSLSNEGITIQDESGDVYTWASGTLAFDTPVDFGQEMLTSMVEAAGIFTVLNKGWNHIVTEGGQDPGHVDVCFPDPSTRWNNVEECLFVESVDIDSPDTMLHEYGHALMHKAFGGAQISPGGPHQITDLVQDPGLAYSEGWASAFALSVCPDGIYDWHEGADEGAGEWPTCTVQNDGGGFGFEEAWLPDVRLGEQNEGRVGAAINDLLDLSDDDNSPGGTAYLDYGRNSYEDDNRNDRISLATIYRDHMWNFVHNDFRSFYGSLLGDISGTTKTLTEDILLFNWMGFIGAPILCVASKVAMALSPDYVNVLDGLRLFRDKVMKPLRVGRHWIQSYYIHSPEMAILLIGNSDAQQAGQVIVEHFSQFGHTLSRPKGLEELSNSQKLVLPTRVMNSIKKVAKVIEGKGSPELKKKLAEARTFLKRFDGMSVSQAVRQVSGMEKVGRGKGALRIQPMKFAPGSQKVDWELIKKNLSSEERSRRNLKAK